MMPTWKSYSLQRGTRKEMASISIPVWLIERYCANSEVNYLQIQQQQTPVNKDSCIECCRDCDLQHYSHLFNEKNFPTAALTRIIGSPFPYSVFPHSDGVWIFVSTPSCLTYVTSFYTRATPILLFMVHCMSNKYKWEAQHSKKRWSDKDPQKYHFRKLEVKRTFTRIAQTDL